LRHARQLKRGTAGAPWRPDEAAIARLHADSWRAAYRGILRDDFLDDTVVANRA